MDRVDSPTILHSSALRSVRRELARLGELWALPVLEHRVDVSFSPRLRVRLGRATPAAGTVRLHTALADAPRALLREALCHEAAHLAVFWLHGAGARPHGPEWAELVRRAGYEPLTKLPVELPGPTPARRSARSYEHLCPVCQSVRMAGRPMRRWRCKACVESGLAGDLEIRRLER